VQKNTTELLNAADTYYGTRSELPTWLSNGTVIYHYGDTGVETQWGPVIDGVEITVHPMNAIASGKLLDNSDLDEVIIGTNSGEGTGAAYPTDRHRRRYRQGVAGGVR